MSVSLAARADAFPDKPIELVVPFTAGGSTDAMARIISPPLSEILKVPVVVVNKPGASGIIAMKYVLAADNGYKIGVSGGTNFGTILAVSKNPPYKVTDAAGIGRAVVNPIVLIARNGRFQNFAAFVKEARDNPESITYASWGANSPGHLYGELVAQTANVKLRHIPYDGGGKAALSAMAGHTDVAVVTLASAIGSIRNGKVTALAISSEQRDPDASQVPTVKELGFPGATFVAFDGFVASAQAPKAQVEILREAFARVLNDPKTKEALRNAGMQPGVQTGPEYDEFVRNTLVTLKTIAVKSHLEE